MTRRRRETFESAARTTAIAAAILATAVVAATMVQAQEMEIFTTTPEFETGTTVSVDTSDDELKLGTTETEFPLLWIANAGEDTVSKIDVDLPSPAFIPDGGCEVARYETWFSTGVHGAFTGPAPSHRG